MDANQKEEKAAPSRPPRGEEKWMDEAQKGKNKTIRIRRNPVETVCICCFNRVL